MLYLWLKIFHVISSAVLFGTGIGTAFYMFYLNLQKDVELIASATRQVVFADWAFTGTAGIIQFITGFSMIYLKGYSFTELWIWGSILGYAIAGLCWFPVVYLQIQCRDIASECFRANKPLNAKYSRYFKIWWILGIPAFLSLVMVFFLMANKPM